MTIGEIMRQRREAAGLAQLEVARRGGPTNVYQSFVEHGKRENVSLALFIRWCGAIGCKPEEVFAEIVAERKDGA